MQFDGQTIAAVVIVIAAGFRILRRGLAVFRARYPATCGGCTKCCDGERRIEVVEIPQMKR